MARKSRKPVGSTPATEQKTPGFLTAIYVRLSIEDNGIGSESIENQISIIRQHIIKQPDLQVVEQFVDNGQTGTNFHRPGFAAMMDGVRTGKINCIVVKDLSRFGRNYLETGDYLEKIFPCLGIRFISVTDHFDSLHTGENDTLLVPLKSILHDTYAKDISKKVSTAIDVKKKSGKYMGKTPPYGYIIDPKDRYKLIVHPKRAETVRQIFQWRLEGMGLVTIARRLNDLGIPTQLQIRFEEGHADGKPNALWRASVVTDILKNPCYLGGIVERKGSNALYKGRNHRTIPISEWKLIENMHEPIIDNKTFYHVQKFIEISRQKKGQRIEDNAHRQHTENVLSGIVRCGICGGRLHRDSGYFKKDGSLVHYSLLCSNKYIKTDGCCSKAVLEESVKECVFRACKHQLDLLTPAINTDWEKLLLSFKNAPSLSKEMCNSMLEQVVIYENRIRVHFMFAWGFHKTVLSQDTKLHGGVL